MHPPSGADGTRYLFPATFTFFRFIYTAGPCDLMRAFCCCLDAQFPFFQHFLMQLFVHLSTVISSDLRSLRSWCTWQCRLPNIVGLPGSCSLKVGRSSPSRLQVRSHSRETEPMAGEKMVAVIGAGPSGLVAAKSMLEVGLYPVIFDKASEIGGIWNPKSGSCWASLKTNISRYCCCFSDFPWDSEAPTFPCQLQMFDYLKAFTDQFLDSKHLCLGSEVTTVTRNNDGKWVIQWSSSQKTGSETFDFVVFASGIYSIPYTPNIPGLDDFSGEVMHSSDYRLPEKFKGKRVVVVGASHSSAEIAADIALHAYQVVNVVRRPFWVLPRYIALKPDSSNTPFFPLDLVFFRRSRRTTSASKEEQYEKANQYFRKLCGNQWALNPVHDSDPPFIVISDTYQELVQCNRILVQRGTLKEVHGSKVILDDDTVLADIDCIIFCTGFRTSLAYLPPELLEALCFDPCERFLPVLVHHSTFHPSLPGSAFVGMYHGPFFGVLELQARWAAGIFSGVLPPVPDAVQQEGIAFAKQIKEQIPRTQVPHGDYVGFSDAIAAELNVLPSKDWCDRHDVVIPAHFRKGSVAEKAVEQLEKACQELSEGSMVSQSVFHSLAGSWKFHRRIENRMDSGQSGTVEGTANFSPLASSLQEYVYGETGELTMASGQRFQVYRKYVYVYDTNANRIDVFFEDQGTRGSPFHSLRFFPFECCSATEDSASETSGGWRAEGQHLCGEDKYHASYRFDFGGNSLAKMEISYLVIGPKKDYTSTATYLR